MPPTRPLDIYKAEYQAVPAEKVGLYSVLLQMSQEFTVRQVLYPGSYVHITPSLFFPHVVYVDNLSGIADMMADSDLRDYIAQHKLYPGMAKLRCYQQDYHTFNTGPEEAFDLLISQNAGLISQACKHFLDSGGLLLVNDGHYDARRAFVDPDYLLLGAFNWENPGMTTAEPELSSYFKTAGGVTLTLEMVESDLSQPPSRARFEPAQSAAQYLFRKQS
jgi:hypothetical protein